MQNNQAAEHSLTLAIAEFAAKAKIFSLAFSAAVTTYALGFVLGIPGKILISVIRAINLRISINHARSSRQAIIRAHFTGSQPVIRTTCSDVGKG